MLNDMVHLIGKKVVKIEKDHTITFEDGTVIDFGKYEAHVYKPMSKSFKFKLGDGVRVASKEEREVLFTAELIPERDEYRVTWNNKERETYYSIPSVKESVGCGSWIMVE